MEQKLTGQHRYRTNWVGRLILQVQCEIFVTNSVSPKKLIWRDATVEDLAEIDMTSTLKAKGK